MIQKEIEHGTSNKKEELKKKKFRVILLFIFFQVTQSCGTSNENLKISALEHFNRGNSHFNNNNLNSAINEYQRAISLDPEQGNYYYNIGLAYYSLFLYENAIESYWKAIKLKPDFAEAWYNLALAFNKVDETEKSFMALDKYKKLNKVKRNVDLRKNKEKQKKSQE